MTPQKRSDDFQLTDVVLLQVVLRQLENEAMMRYISNPDNTDAIVALILQAKNDMGGLQGRGLCPPKWHHEADCRCVPDEFEGMGLRDRRPSRGAIRPEDVLGEIERLSGQVHQLFKRFRDMADA